MAKKFWSSEEEYLRFKDTALTYLIPELAVVVSCIIPVFNFFFNLLIFIPFTIFYFSLIIRFCFNALVSLYKKNMDDVKYYGVLFALLSVPFSIYMVILGIVLGGLAMQ